jgi:hypothetical protein
VNRGLSAVLTGFLPGPEDTLLLRACLHAGESGRWASDSWLARLRADDLSRETVKSFLPLLFRAVRTHSINVEPWFLTILKTAALREELRTRTYRSIAGRVLSALSNRVPPVIPIGGVVLGETVYPDAALRHSHDVEILVQDDDHDPIGRSLIALAFTTSGTNEDGSLELVHPSGLPLVLRRALFEIPFYNAGLREMTTRARDAVILGSRVPVLSPADVLLHTSGRAACPRGRESHRWVADAWFIIHHHPDLDWETFLQAATHASLALPVSVALEYLAEALDARVPASVLSRLAVASSSGPPIGRELALLGARSAGRGGFRHLLRQAGDWSVRLQVIRWILAPSPTYVRWVSRHARCQLLPAQYVSRPASYLARRVRSALRRTVGWFTRARLRYFSSLVPSQRS